MGVLYLLTGGLCGIGVIIDLIKLINGDLQPLGGSFDESWKNRFKMKMTLIY